MNTLTQRINVITKHINVKSCKFNAFPHQHVRPNNEKVFDICSYESEKDNAQARLIGEATALILDLQQENAKLKTQIALLGKEIIEAKDNQMRDW